MSQPILEFEFYKEKGYPFYKKVFSEMTEEQRIIYTYNNIYRRMYNCDGFVAWRDTKCGASCGKFKHFYIIALNLISLFLIIFSLSFNKKVKTSLFEPITLLESNFIRLNNFILISGFLTYIISLVLLTAWSGTLNMFFFILMLILFTVLLTECILFYNIIVEIDSSQYDTYKTILLFYIIIIVILIIIHCIIGFQTFKSLVSIKTSV